MPRRSFAVELPVEEKAWLDQELVRRGFANYDELADALQEKGVDTSRSAVARYGQQLQTLMESIRASTQVAKVIAEATPDEADSRSAATISMLQTGMLNALMSLDQARERSPEEQLEIFSKSARSIADLTRASLAQKRHQADVDAKLNAAKQAAATAAERVAKQAGLTDEDWGAIRAHILGIEVKAS